MFFLERTISYWQLLLPNVLYQWQWQWRLNSATSTAPSPTLHAHRAHQLAWCHANHTCTWRQPCHHLQGIVPASLNTTHVRTCARLSSSTCSSSRFSLMLASRLLADKEKLVMPTAQPRAMGHQGGSLFWADWAAYRPPALSHPGPAKPYPKLHKFQSW